MKIDAGQLGHQELNDQLRMSREQNIIIDNCLGQRYLASGSRGKKVTVTGTPGNALGSYLDGTEIDVYGNVQEATGDTMNGGAIYIHGSAGDATGYAMRGGKILIQGDTGYRAGVHMKEYKDKIPAIVVGGVAGSFLGEYQAGGVIVVLGLHRENQPIAGYFCGTGMHGGKIYLRSDTLPEVMSPQATAEDAGREELEAIKPLLEEFCRKFREDLNEILRGHFFVLTQNTKNPYRQLYIQN